MSSKDIMDAALQLSEQERVEIVERLLETLPDGAGNAVDERWAAELDRRRNDYHRHPETAVPGSEPCVAVTVIFHRLATKEYLEARR